MFRKQSFLKGMGVCFIIAQIQKRINLFFLKKIKKNYFVSNCPDQNVQTILTELFLSLIDPLQTVNRKAIFLQPLQNKIPFLRTDFTSAR